MYLVYVCMCGVTVGDVLCTRGDVHLDHYTLVSAHCATVAAVECFSEMLKFSITRVGRISFLYTRFSIRQQRTWTGKNCSNSNSHNHPTKSNDYIYTIKKNEMIVYKDILINKLFLCTFDIFLWVVVTRTIQFIYTYQYKSNCKIWVWCRMNI